MRTRAFFVLLLAALAGASAVADTYVSGTITASTTWTLANSPYVVTGHLDVNNTSGTPPVLTIEPGVVVKVDSGKYINVGYNQGGIVAQGTSSQPIVFTANGTVSAGYWCGLYLLSGVTSGSQLSYVTVEGGGYDAGAPGRCSGEGGISIRGGSVTLSNVTAQTNRQAGIAVRNASPTISSSSLTSNSVGDGVGLDVRSGASVTMSGTSITNNSGAAVMREAGATLTGLTGMTVTGNGSQAVRFRSSVITADERWQPIADLPYVPDGHLDVDNAYAQNPPVLTIDPGVTVRFKYGKYFSVGYDKGALYAVGTASLPIRFTSETDPASVGLWCGIYLNRYSGTSAISYATVEGGGYDMGAPWKCLGEGGIVVLGGTPAISNVTVQTNRQSGIKVRGGSPTISSSTLTSNSAGDGVGLDVRSGASVTMSGTSITNNSGAAVMREAGATLAGLTGMTVTGNGSQAVRFRSSVITVDERWQPIADLPYVPDGHIDVDNAYAQNPPVLTIDPGVTVRFKYGKYFSVGYDKGALRRWGLRPPRSSSHRRALPPRRGSGAGST